MKRYALVVAVLTLLSGCGFFGDGPRGAADELAELAALVDEATYAAVYRASFVRQAAPGVSTRLEIVQQGPVTIRKIRSTTKRPDGKNVDVAYSLVRNSDGEFACNEFDDIGIRCERNPVGRSSFGSAKWDPFFDAPRQADAFTEVRKEGRQQRIAGHLGTCFEAIPLSPAPPTAGPEASASPEVAERFRYELCYADDGILLRGRRTTLEEGGPADNAESFVEIASLSRVVEPAELRLPGPVVDPNDL